MNLTSKIGYRSGSITAELSQYAMQTYLFFHYAVEIHRACSDWNQQNGAGRLGSYIGL